MVAARAMLDRIHPTLPNEMGDENVYILGNIGAHNIVITGLREGTYGATSATVAAFNMRQSYPSVKFCFLAGIAGCVPDPHDIRLGDVIVADPSASYGGVFQYDREQRNCRPYKTPDIVLTTLASLKAKHRHQGSDIPIYQKEAMKRHPRLSQLAQYPGESVDQLFAAEGNHVLERPTCNRRVLSGVRQRPRRPDNSPTVFYGLVASGGMLLKDAAERDAFAQQYGAICFEMEAAGILDILPCVVVRGVCDYADSHKNDRWQGYAAMAAAAYTKEFLSHLPSRGGRF
ncbi:hypothetical protein ASPSYDRAFT_44660 [Aspergillus sydowii CBS 593.65]|uniref:Nucleoside phosphorylase domain-containing protein n=1 Tax=Aspergillus sydowii CBS 593.65 TaxID=1036612 RepID=A0A1L9TLB9_9EURO|nr:uncharacterized protein ASPSYDRAFT_44660 [Aspergillus sydowii CBS 593.65]OJJ60228.1 hypothetical protein ASPSYDRAFT_44660 [Aspergillus sydowii CBS 593.65]